MSGNRQPWPMKWIVVAILLLIVPYTFITLRYRKAGPAFQPYEDIKNRANVSRLLAAGYQRIPIIAQRPADTGRAPGGASITNAPGGVPQDLQSTLVEPLSLPTDITSVTASADASAAQPYAIQLACTLPDDKRQLGGADLYVRGEQLVIAPTFEQITSDLLARSRHAAVLLTIPPGALKPGHYTVTLIAQHGARTWPLEVR
jgi:hypothetical protein